MIIVAVSGGLDSMCLLDILYKQNKDIVIAHLNYQKRDDSYKDALIIKEYISNKNIIYEEKIVDKKEYTKANFQAQARNIRYNFFIDLANKYNTKDIYVAHHKDDFIETYLFKKERKGNYDFYGIKEISNYQGYHIIRPLLNYYKEDLIKYIKDHNLKYHEDSSNNSDLYTRNKIRKYLSNLSIKQKEAIYQEALSLNNKINKEIAIVNDIKKHIISIEEFKSYDLNIKRRYLFKVINNYSISTKHLDNIISNLENNDSYQFTFLNTTIYKAYGSIYMLNFFIEEYHYIINNDNDYNKFKKLWYDLYHYQIKDTNISYPFIIRSYHKEDLIKLDMTNKKFRSKLKKQKIPFFLRDYLPLIEKDNVLAFIY